MSISEDLPRWSLYDLAAAAPDQAAQELLAQLDAHVSALEAERPALSPTLSPQALLGILHRYELIAELSSRLRALAYLWYAEDTQNPAALTLRSRLDSLLTDAHNRTLFVSLWFKGLPDDAAERFVAGAGELRYYLQSLRRFKPFTLSEAEEKLINLKDVNGVDALVKVYEMITNRFSFHLQIGGASNSLTRDQLAVYFRSPDPDVRAAAYGELFRVYGDSAAVLSQIYNHRARDWHAEAVSLRGYAQPISFRNLANDLPDAVVDTLLAVCRQNADLFQRYFRLKARRLGVERLRRYDIYAPLAASGKRYAFPQAREMVLSTFAAFSPLVAGHAARVMDSRHLDAAPRPGKRSGAFCYSPLPGLPPWVLLNYTGQARDVATLAHELGHAVHSSLAADHSVLTFSPSLPLAETASVFSEMLLTDRLLTEEQDGALRRDILAHALDDAYVTVMRQAFFTLFERDAHRLSAGGASFDDLCACYMDNLHEQFGDALDTSSEFRLEWISIPHFYNAPFYTYAYSFGQLLVLALYQQYRAEGAAFTPRYLSILSAGGSDAPATVLGRAGLDIGSAGFWQGGFDVIAGLIDEMESLTQ